MRGPVDVAACGCVLAFDCPLPVPEFSAVISLLEITPEPGSGDTSHFALPS
jgi:hypothetical protein